MSFANFPMGTINPTLEMSFQGIVERAGLATNLEVCLDAGDANSYTSGVRWLDTSGNSNNFLFGAAAGAGTDDPTFNGTPGGLSSSEYMAFDGGDSFHYDGSIPDWANNIAYDNANFTLVCVFAHPETANGAYFFTTYEGASAFAYPVFQWDWGTAEKVGFYVAKQGANVWSSSGVVYPDNVTTNNTPHFLAVSLNEATGAGGAFFYEDGDYSQIGSADTRSSTYSNPGTGDGRGPFIGGTGSSNRIDNGAKMYGLMVFNAALSKANLDALYAEIGPRFGLS